MLRITLRTAPETIAALKAKGPQIVRTLVSKLNILMFGLARYIQTEKLSAAGPNTLAPRSGRLRGSVRAIPVEISGTRITGRVEAGGGPVGYAAYHEFGNQSAYEIVATKKKALAFVMGGKQQILARVLHPKNAARAFMSSALEENKNQIFQTLQQAVSDVVAEKE